MWQRIVEFFRSLFGKKKSAPPEAPRPESPYKPEPRTQATMAPVSTTRGHSIDYKHYAQWNRYDLQTVIFPMSGYGNHGPEGWDWKLYEAARGDPDGQTHTISGRKIEPLPPFANPSHIEGSGEFDIFRGETKTIHCFGPSLAAWVFHAPTTSAPGTLMIGDKTYGAGSGPQNTVIPAGTHIVKLLEGPPQGVRFALQPTEA